MSAEYPTTVEQGPEAETLSGFRVSLSMMLFHRKAYKATLDFIKSEAGKDVLREVVSARQAHKFWGERNAGAAYRNTLVLFKSPSAEVDDQGNVKKPGPGGVTLTTWNIDGEEVVNVNLAQEHVARMGRDTRMKSTIFIGDEADYPKADGSIAISGDYVSIVFLVGHEATLHAKYDIQFAVHLANGVGGEELVQKFNESYSFDGTLKYMHAAGRTGLNETYNKFVQWFDQKFGAANRKLVDEQIEGDKMYMDNEGEDLQQRINNGEIDPAKF